MKLIDLLVQELPKRGGWPDGAVECCWFRNDKQVYFYDENGESPEDFTNDGNYNFNLDHVTYKPTAEGIQEIPKSEYEAALAASKQPEWNGEGLPPVGCECEAFDGVSWFPVVIVGRYDGFAFAWNYDYRKTLTVNEVHSINFRPILTEVERKRNKAISDINILIGDIEKYPTWRDAVCGIYDAIAAGKIKGLKVE